MTLKDKHKRKALIEASIVMLLLILLMFISGMTYLDPPPETGIAVNFGSSEKGRGLIQPKHNKPVKTPTQKKAPKPETKPVIKEQVLTQNNTEAPVIKKTTKKNKPKLESKPKPKPKPKPDKHITDILNNVANAPGQENQEKGGEGNDTKSGDKGLSNGDPDASGYYGAGGHGASGNGNYRLGNRNAKNKPKPAYNCNEEGRVVVKIYVNRQGRVIKAIPGVKGSTNNAPCLLQAAKYAALKTRWTEDTKAPETQIGKIIYNFKVTE